MGWSGNIPFGSQLVQFALIWWLTETTGSAVILASASLVGLLPQVILGPFLGVLVDRWNRRWTMFLSDSSVMLATMVLALLFWLDVAELWHVFVILFIRAVAGSFHWPAMTASTSLMVPEEQLTRVQGLNQTLNGGLNIAAAPLGALLISFMPLQGILAIDAATAIFAIIPLLLISIPQPVRKVGLDSAATSFMHDMKDGLAYVRGWPALMVIMGISMLMNFLLNPAFSLLPLLVTDYFGGGAYHLSVLEVAFGVGIVVGGGVLGAWGGFRNKVATSLSGALGFGISILVVAFAPPHLFVLAVIGMFGGGLTNSLLNGPIMAIIQAVVAPEKQGRVFTLLGSVSSAMAPLGLMVAGPLADVFGVRGWLALAGVAMLLLGIFGYWIPPLINIEKDAAQFQGAREPA
ncbi:MAG: MFS transporter [Anaerolineales bacterium]|nr:MFS transporter [Anaerolineales bacterium]